MQRKERGRHVICSLKSLRYSDDVPQQCVGLLDSACFPKKALETKP